MNSRSLIWLLLLSIYLVAFPPNRAFSSELEDLAPFADEMLLFQDIPSVTGASKYEQRMTEAPSSVTVITVSEIKKHGYRTLAEILRSARGLFTTYDRNYSFIGLRGFARPGDLNTRVLLLIDGHRINDNIFDQALIGTEFPLDIDLIERVEIIRGPSSSIYGSNAFLGVINVMTRRGKDLKGMEMSADAGSFETYKGRVTYGDKYKNGLELLLSGSTFTSQGPNLFYKEFKQSNGGIANHCDDDSFNNLFSNLSWGDFNLQGVYHSREKGIPTGSFETVFADSRNRTLDERAYFDLKYDHRFDNELGLSARLFYDHYNYLGRYVYDYPGMGNPADRVLNADYAKGRWAGGELQLSGQFFDRHYVIMGSEVRANLMQGQGNYDVSPFRQWLSASDSSTVWAGYLQDEYKIRDDLILNAGVRHDEYTTFGGATNPRFALIYTPTEKSALKLLYGTAFRAPNAYEIDYADILTSKANGSLKPEKIETYEAIWEQYFHKYWRLSVSGYLFEIDDLITLTRDPSDGLLQYRNMDSVTGKGLEIELDRHWIDKWETSLSYALQETRDGRTDHVVPNSPRHVMKFRLIAPLFQEWLFAAPEVRWMSSRSTLSGDGSGSFVIGNLTLFSDKLLNGLEVSASVYNIFDQKYSDPGSQEHLQDLIEQDGRTFRFKLTYRF
ncbi:MAG: TonB-dependent receptor [Syntrophobacteraceae bacterium]